MQFPIIIGSSVILLILGVSHKAFGQTATYNGDVACILNNHCTTCHHDGGIAPFSLMTFDESSVAAVGVLAAVNAGTMPPWPPNTSYNRLAHERLLTPEEIDIINNWVNGGLVEGSEPPPQPPVYSGTEEISNPDLVLTMPEYTINTTGTDVFKCFVVPTQLQEDVFITELEVVPGNREAVHHVMLYQDETNVPQQLDDAEPGPGYTSFGSTNSEASIPIAGWNPGQGKKIFPQGMGVRIPTGATIVMQVHYPGTANGQTDQTKLNIKYTTEPLREINISSFIHHFDLNEGTLTIPANEVRTFTGDYTLPNSLDITLLDVNIHMHLLGKSARAWAELPNNQTIPFIEIEDWDFHWQGFYDFRQPVRIAGGTTFHAEATYDNTINNLDNPNDPPQTINVGNDSDDEMMLVFFSYLDYQPGDENIVVDTSTVHPVHLCEPLGLEEKQPTQDLLVVYPNPSDNEIIINLQNPQRAVVSIVDALGRVVKQRKCFNSCNTNVSELPNGMYVISAWNDDKELRTRICVQHK